MGNENLPYQKITKCRISGSPNLVPILDLGSQVLTGVFPKDLKQQISQGPLSLIWCPDSGLIQLEHSFSLSEMYGSNYGYRSGLNPTMVEHLANKVQWLERNFNVESQDVIIDIGSNDGTLLNAYNTSNLNRIGFDPVASKYLDYYDKSISVIPDFFSKLKLDELTNKKAKIITSIAMFYDLEDPSQFVKQISQTLSSDGVWHFEQSYLPSMLKTNSYDTICHEHLEYYSLNVVKNLLEANNLKIVDVQTNQINGGSFAVTAALQESRLIPDHTIIKWLIEQELKLGLDTLVPYEKFKKNVIKNRKSLVDLIYKLSSDGKKVIAYGASTKGNVILQYCGFGPENIKYVAEVNQEKFGSFTPGSNIPIISEAEAKLYEPDYMLVLPWHFRDFIIKKERKFLERGGRLIFPLPDVEIVCY
jgi:hypothetical protein